MKKNIEIVPNLQKLFGTRDENLQIMESGLNVAIDPVSYTHLTLPTILRV